MFVANRPFFIGEDWLNFEKVSEVSSSALRALKWFFSGFGCCCPEINHHMSYHFYRRINEYLEGIGKDLCKDKEGAPVSG